MRYKKILNTKTTIMEQTGKMYNQNCISIAGTAIHFLQEGIKSKLKLTKVNYLKKASELIEDEKFTWDGNDELDSLAHKYESLFDKLLAQIES